MPGVGHNIWFTADEACGVQAACADRLQVQGPAFCRARTSTAGLRCPRACVAERVQSLLTNMVAAARPGGQQGKTLPSGDRTQAQQHHTHASPSAEAKAHMHAKTERGATFCSGHTKHQDQHEHPHVPAGARAPFLHTGAAAAPLWRWTCPQISPPTARAPPPPSLRTMRRLWQRWGTDSASSRIGDMYVTGACL